jgi:hypothetical protein
MDKHTLAKHPSQTLTLGLLTAFLLAGCLSPSPTVTDIPTATESPKATESPTATAIPTVRERECPKIICFDMLGVYLVGIRSDDYTLTAVAPDGTSVQVRCVDEIGQSGARAGQARAECGRTSGIRPYTILFLDFTPEIVTVTLAWDGNEISQKLEPEYDLYQPGGPDCPPTCRVGSAVLNLLKSP